MTMLPEADSFSQALYTFDIGQNDLTAAYFANKTVEQIGTTDVPEIISQFKNAVTVGLSVLYSVTINAFCLKVIIIKVFVIFVDSIFTHKEGDTSGFTTQDLSVV